MSLENPPPVVRLERDDFSSNRHLALAYWWSMILFRKPVSTPDQVRGRLFRDHALSASAARRRRRYSTTILTLSPGLSASPGSSPLIMRKRSSARSGVAIWLASRSIVSPAATVTTFRRSGLAP